MKTDADLNYLIAIRLMQWTESDGHFINSMKQKRFAIADYQPLSNQSHYEEMAGKMQARDYQLTVRQTDGVYEVEFAKYGEKFSFRDKSLTRAGSIAALLAYQQDID